MVRQGSGRVTRFPAFARFQRGFGAVFSPELGKDVVHVPFDGADADIQDFSDVLVAFPEGGQTQDLTLAVREQGRRSGFERTSLFADNLRVKTLVKGFYQVYAPQLIKKKGETQTVLLFDFYRFFQA